jgi:putative ABC transport system permease protein
MLSNLRTRLRALLRKSEIEHELDEELRYHIEQQTEQNIRLGMDPEDARRAAKKAFGGVEQAKEHSRDARGVRWIDDLWQDLRYGARMLMRNPGFTLIVALTLALGIGANTAMFSIIHAVLLRPLPYKDADRLVAVFASPVGQAQDSKVFASYRDFKEWKLQSRSFEQLEACSWAAESGKILLGRGAAQRVLSIPVTAGYFSLLGARAAQGRTFGTQDEKMACAVVLSHGFWKDRLGGAPDIVGSSLRLDDQACAVIGVMPNAFEFYPRQAQLWTLITPQSAFERGPWEESIGVFGRLKPDVSAASAQAELRVLHQQIVRDAPLESKSWGQFEPMVSELQSEFTWLAGRNLRTGLVVLFGAVVCVLLIACVNVASLQLARASQRERELAVRAALGSGRSRLIRQMMTETMTLALLGAALGTAIAIAVVSWFRSATPVELPPGNAVTVNWQTLVFTAGLAILTGLLSGLTPAWKASQIDLNEALKDATRGASGVHASRAARLFIIAEVALSLTLLAGAGLLIQSIVRLSSVHLGFGADHLLTAQLTLPSSEYPEPKRQADFYNNLIARLRALPGVEGAAVSAPAGWNLPLTTADRTPAQTEVSDISLELVSADYLATMGIPLMRGRPFADSDRESSQPVAIINEALARKYFPNKDPIGQQIKLGTFDSAPRLTVVGIAGNVKDQSLFDEMKYEASPLAYRPMNQSAGGSVRILLRAAGNVAGLPSALQGEVFALDKGIPVSDVETMEHQISKDLAHPRFRAVLLSCFAGLALLLVAIGIYGMLSESVSHRTREIGIRMALGAERRDVLLLFIKHGLRLMLVGAAIGVAGSLLGARFLTGMLYGVKPADPVTFVTVLLVLGGVAALASYFPARRATKVDPMAALHNE